MLDTRATATVIALALVFAACSQPKVSTPPPPTPPAFTKGPQPSGLVITAASTGGTLTLSAESGLALTQGLTKQLTVTETFANASSQDVTSAVVWSSSSAATGTVSASGLLSAVAVGNAAVTATLGALTESFPLSVEPAITSIAIPTDLSALWVGDSQSVQVVATLSDGSMLDVTAQATFSSNAPAVATVSELAVVTGVSVGASTITATVDSFMATATATVLATEPMLTSIAIGTDNAPPASLSPLLLPGLAQALGVWGTYSETGSVENITANANWTWGSSDTSVATISPGGVVTGVAQGTTMITVSGLGLSASVTMTVTAPVASIAIAGLPASLGPGTYLFPDVLATLSDGTVIDVYPWTTFTSSSRHIAAAEGAAIVGRSMGTATITATLGTSSATSTVNVKPISSLQIVPSSLSMPAGLVDNWIAAFATLSDGSVLDTTETVEWASSAPNVANFGVPSATEANTPFSGLSAGTTTITATVSTFGSSTTATGQATATIEPAVAIESLALSPSTATLDLASSQAVTATATTVSGMLDVTPFVSWGGGASGGSLVFASDFQPGLFSGVSPAGAATITAQIGPASASAVLTVSSATIESITINPPSVSLSSGETQAVTVTATYSDTSTADVTGLVVWTSTDTTGAVAVVNQTPTSRATIVAEGSGSATLTAWVTPSGPYVGGAPETSSSTTVTVQ